MTKAIATYGALILATAILVLLFFTPMAGADGLAGRRAAAIRQARLESLR